MQENQCLVNGKKIGHNPITQTQKVVTSLGHILQNIHPANRIHGNLVFTGQHNEVRIHDAPSHLKILTANQLRQAIWQIAKTERKDYGVSIDKAKIIQQLESFETSNPFQLVEISDTLKNQMHRGICCSHCGNFAINTRKSYIVCPCGMHEAREVAIIRTICEYGVLHADDD